MKNRLRVMLLIVLGSLLAACNFSGGPKADKGALSAWIDKPLNESTHVLGPIEILGHGAAYNDVSMLELSYFYGDSLERTLIGSTAPDIVNIKQGSGASTAAVLGRAKWSWIPPTIGTYLLNLRVQRGDGAWSDYGKAQITVIMPDLPIGGVIQPEPGQGPQPVSSPTPTSTSTPTPEPACTNQAKFIADITIPDNTNLAPGAAFTKIWRLQNSGTCTWDENYKVVFVGGAPLSNPTPQSVPGIVAPGATVDISLNLVAPGVARDLQERLPAPQPARTSTSASAQTAASPSTSRSWSGRQPSPQQLPQPPDPIPRRRQSASPTARREAPSQPETTSPSPPTPATMSG